MSYTNKFEALAKDLQLCMQLIEQQHPHQHKPSSHLQAQVFYSDEINDLIHGGIPISEELAEPARKLNKLFAEANLSIKLSDLHPEDFKAEDIASWDYPLLLDEGDPQRQLSFLFSIFQAYDLLTHFKIDKTKFLAFLQKLQTLYSYNKNPFHNFTHACAVTHGTFSLIANTKFLQQLDPLDILLMLVAALGHDADHSGFTNAFEVASNSKLAIRYHDQSVLEQHHAATLFMLLSMPDTSILESLSAE